MTQGYSPFSDDVIRATFKTSGIFHIHVIRWTEWLSHSKRVFVSDSVQVRNETTFP